MSRGSSNLAQVSAEPVLEMILGPGKGKTFSFSGSELTVGRSSDNSVSLESASVSRHHATFSRDSHGNCFVRDNQSKNGVQVNGTSVDEKELKHGDVVQIGEFAFRIYLGTSIAEAGALAKNVGGHPQVFQDLGMAKPLKLNIPNRRPMIYGLGALLLLGLWWMSGGEPSKKPEKVESTTAGSITDQLQDIAERPSSYVAPPKNNIRGLEDPVLNPAEQEVKRFDFGDNAKLEAEQYFRRGRREYMNKNYHRGIQDFKAALSFKRDHYLANLYLRFAVADAETEAKLNLDKAVSYFQTLQYARAIYHFQQVIELMQHRKSDKLVEEARKYIETAKVRLRGAELFP